MVTRDKLPLLVATLHPVATLSSPLRLGGMDSLLLQGDMDNLLLQEDTDNLPLNRDTNSLLQVSSYVKIVPTVYWISLCVRSFCY